MFLFTLLAVDNFENVRGVLPRSVSESAIATVKELDEREEIEAWIQAILHDTNRTSHGPSEVVDIFTHKLAVRGQEGLAAFILKGKSFPTVRPSHVSHQIFRLEDIQGLDFAIFAASGNVLDDVKRQFVSTARRLGCGYCILCPPSSDEEIGVARCLGQNPYNLDSLRVAAQFLSSSRIEARASAALRSRNGANRCCCTSPRSPKNTRRDKSRGPSCENTCAHVECPAPTPHWTRLVSYTGITREGPPRIDWLCRHE
jgi:hypothetical protein